MAGRSPGPDTNSPSRSRPEQHLQTELREAGARFLVAGSGRPKAQGGVGKATNSDQMKGSNGPRVARFPETTSSPSVTVIKTLWLHSNAISNSNRLVYNRKFKRYKTAISHI